MAATEVDNYFKSVTESSGHVFCTDIISSRFLLRPFDVTITSNMLFVRSLKQFVLNGVLDVIFHSSWNYFFVHSRDLIFGHRHR